MYSNGVVGIYNSIIFLSFFSGFVLYQPAGVIKAVIEIFAAGGGGKGGGDSLEERKRRKNGSAVQVHVWCILSTFVSAHGTRSRVGLSRGTFGGERCHNILGIGATFYLSETTVLRGA